MGSFKINAMKKFLGILSVVVVLALVIFLIVRYFWVFGDGVKAGTLNYIVHKGYIFKTYEGELIQTGLQSKAPNSLMSNDFTCSLVGSVFIDAFVPARLNVNRRSPFQSSTGAAMET